MGESIEFISRGGLFLAPIIGASVIALALFLDRLWYLRRSRIVPQQFIDALQAMLVDDGTVADVRALCDRIKAPVARVIGRGVQAGETRDVMRQSMEDGGRLELHLMRRYTGALASIATVAPLLGLLGTVVGMITTFQSIVASVQQGAGAVDVGQLAGGIWEALITTAAGLVVAIPVVVGHRYVIGRIERLLSQIEDLGGRVIDHLGSADSELQEEAP